MSSGRCVSAAVFGGAIGAAKWGALAYFAGQEIGWTARGIGVIAGICVRIAGGGNDGKALGVIAAGISWHSIAVGTYGAVCMEKQCMFREVGRQEMTDEIVRLYTPTRP